MLRINDHSFASREELEAGIHAATRVFDNAGWRPSLVWRVLHGDDDAARATARAIWDKAEERAFAAAFRRWHRRPAYAALVYVEPTHPEDVALDVTRSDDGRGGWSIHARAHADILAAGGFDCPLLTGEADWNAGSGRWSAPTSADYAAARAEYARRLADGA